MKFSRLFLWTGLCLLLSGTVRVQAQTNDTLKVIAVGKRATIFIDTPEANGSGFCIHESGVFVTNAHVVKGLAQAKVVLSPSEADQQEVSVRVSHYDAERDLAVLIADPPLAMQLRRRTLLTVLPLGDSSTLFETKPIAVFGFPFGANLAMDEHGAPAVTVTVGRITSLRKFQGELEEIQMDASINPGNSGGPVIDDLGQVIGIVHAGMGGAQGLNFAIPVDRLHQLLREPEIRIELPEVDWQKRSDLLAFDVQVTPFTLFGGTPGIRSAYDLEMAVGYDNHWRNLTVSRLVPNGGNSAEFRVTGVLYEDNVPLDTEQMYRITLRYNGVVIASREDLVPIGEAPSVALTFDGKGDKTDIALKNWPNPGNAPHSVEMWVRPDSLPTRRSWLMVLGGVDRPHHWLYFPSGDFYAGVWGDAGGQIKTTLPVGKWTHVATTFGNGVLKVFLNGQQVAQTNARFNITGNPAVPFTLAKSHMGEAFFHGAVKELRIWDRELDEASIRANLNRSLAGKEPGLILYWPLNEGEGNIIHDRSNHGNNTTLNENDRWVPLDTAHFDVAE